MRISDWSSDVCSSDLAITVRITRLRRVIIAIIITAIVVIAVVIITIVVAIVVARRDRGTDAETDDADDERRRGRLVASVMPLVMPTLRLGGRGDRQRRGAQRDSQTSLFQNGLHRRSDEHTTELQSLMRNTYAVF